MTQPDYDLASLTEQALLLQAQDRTREIAEAHASLDASLQSPALSREDVVDVLVKMGVEQLYAEKAFDQIYPDPQKLATLERNAEAGTNWHISCTNQAQSFLANLYSHLAESLPDVKIRYSFLFLRSEYDAYHSVPSFHFPIFQSLMLPNRHYCVTPRLALFFVSAPSFDAQEDIARIEIYEDTMGADIFMTVYRPIPILFEAVAKLKTTHRIRDVEKMY
ncbi:MAG: hypothetical protein Q7R76_06220 [Candidatus Woesearchaeota archaeon]|nr:hypothetical protein [Candidatus Woesearchaeota archaeon]